MDSRGKRPLKQVALLVSIIFFIACEKPEESLGIDLQPEEDILGISAIDTFTIEGQTLPEDSILTDNVLTGLVGAYIDPQFGYTKAEHTSEIRLTTSNPVFFLNGSSIENLVVDSLILNLSFNRGFEIPVYGSTGEQFFQVFEVIDSLDVTEDYYDQTTVDIIGEDLIMEGHNMQRPDYLSSVFIDDEEALPAVRLPLKHELAQRIFDASTIDGLSAVEFLELIKGLQITVDENAPGVNLAETGLVLFDTDLGFSRIELYYRDTGVTTSTGQDSTLFYDFELRSGTGKYNGFQHDFLNGGNPNLIRQVINEIPDSGKELLYVQAGGGTKLRVDLPYLENLKQIDGIALAKAELILPVNESSGGRFTVPSRLLLFALDENEDSFVLDEFLQDPAGFSFIDGAFDSENNQYRFILTRFLQQVLNGEKQFNGFEIVSQRASTTANRVILNGAENPGEKLRLEIIFTNF